MSTPLDYLFALAFLALVVFLTGVWSALSGDLRRLSNRVRALEFQIQAKQARETTPSWPDHHQP